MQSIEGRAEPAGATGAHYQMFLFGSPATIRWRLLSGNNRDMCHGVEEFADPQRCKQSIEQLRGRIPVLHPVIKRDDNGEWTWLLLDGTLPVATAGHSYDRQIRCSRAMMKVLADAPLASIRTQMVVSDHRRWAGSNRTAGSGSAARPLLRLQTGTR